MPKPDGSSISSPEIDQDVLDVARAAAGPATIADDANLSDDTVDDQQDAGANNDAAGSSDAADGKQPQSKQEAWDPLSAVKKAIEKDKPADQAKDSQAGTGEAAADKSSKSGDGQQQAAPAADGSEDLSDDEKKLLAPKTRKRMEYLLGERQRLSEDNESLKPLAEQHLAFMDYMRDTRMSGDEVTDLLVVGAMAKSGDPKQIEAALKRAREFVSDLENAVGASMPADLQAKIDNGDIDVESAKEVAKARAEKRLSDSKLQQHTQDDQVNQVQRAAEAVNQTVTEWQTQIFQTDPDYQLKAPLLQTRIALMVAQEPGGRVLDPNKALKIAQDAYSYVNEQVKAFRPATPPAKRVLPRGASPTNLAAQPNSPLEAARAALNKK